MRARQLKGFPIIDLESGIMIGRVQDLAVDPLQKKVVALVAGEKGLLKGKGQLLPFSKIHSIGRDAVTVRHESGQNGDAKSAEQLKPYSFLGNSIISSSGDYIARVHDYSFSTETGEVESLLLHDVNEREKKDWEICLLMEGVHSLGRDYVIAATDFGAYLREVPEIESATPVEEEEAANGEAKGAPSDLRGRVSELWERVEREVSREGKELAYETRQQVKTYVLGKKAGRTIKDNRRNFLVRDGEVVTSEIIKTAEAQDRLAPLFFSVLSNEVEDSLNTISDRISRIFKGS